MTRTGKHWEGRGVSIVRVSEMRSDTVIRSSTSLANTACHQAPVQTPSPKALGPRTYIQPPPRLCSLFLITKIHNLQEKTI